MTPAISTHFQGRQPSAIRRAQILFEQRPDRAEVDVINLAIGNVSLPMHPAMQRRMRELGEPGSPFHDGVVRYTPTVGTEETRRAFLRIIESAGGRIDNLRAMVTDGGSAAMELMLLGVCGPSSARPLLLLDPAYANYVDLAKRVSVPTVSVRRELGADATFSRPDLERLHAVVREQKPTALVVIPADNPTGQSLSMDQLTRVARLCVDEDLWLVSDEAYRQLHYVDGGPSSIWLLNDSIVPGIEGRRVSIETASKVFNACGLRIGGLVSDNAEFVARAVAEYTANLCANAIGQYVFGALAHLDDDELNRWYDQQRAYYGAMASELETGLHEAVPRLVVSRPEAALYSVIDVRDVAKPGFDANQFVAWCASEGKTETHGKPETLLVAPMDGFYERGPEGIRIAKTQMRLAFVASPADMLKVPALFAQLFQTYESNR